MDVDREHRPREVFDRDPLGHRVHRVLGGTPQPDLRHDAAELRGGRLGDLLRDGVESLQEAVSRPQRARHDRQDVGKLLLELVVAFGDRPTHDHVRHRAGRDGDQGPEHRRQAEHDRDHPAADRGDHREDDELPALEGQAALLELDVEGRAESARRRDAAARIRNGVGDPRHRPVDFVVADLVRIPR